MGSAAWRTRFEPSLRMFASSTSVSSRSCRKPTARPCWSFAPEKNWRPCWARTRPDGHDPAGTVAGRGSGIGGEAVSLVRATAAHGLLPTDQGRAEGEAGAGRTDQGADRRGAVVWLSDGVRASRHEQEHGPADLPAERLAGAQAGDRSSPED